MTNSEILLYQTEDGQTKIDVRLEEESVWLSQVQMAELFQTTKQNISLHIKNVFEEGELEEISTVKDYLTVQTEGKREVQRKLMFFKSVQNKMHWAIHGHTASEIIYQRTDSEKQNMGLTTWKNVPSGKIRKADVSIAKNYLTEDELKDLNLIVDQYLSFAELQARNRNPMYMSDWANKLNDFMTLNDKEVLGHACKISAKLAKELAESEYEKYRKKMIDIEDAKDIRELEEGLTKLENKKKDNK